MGPKLYRILRDIADGIAGPGGHRHLPGQDLADAAEQTPPVVITPIVRAPTAAGAPVVVQVNVQVGQAIYTGTSLGEFASTRSTNTGDSRGGLVGPAPISRWPRSPAVDSLPIPPEEPDVNAADAFE